MEHQGKAIKFLFLLSLAALATAGPVPPPAGPAPATAGVPRVLQAVRLRPGAEAYRLIFLFDRPVPYTLREASVGRRATLEFMNASLASLPAELARVGDPRLDGVWLKAHDGGLVTLELRFPREVRLEHFSLEEPPAVVIDIYRHDQVATVTGAPEVTTLTPQPGAPSPTPPPDAAPQIPAVPRTVLIGQRGSILPPAMGAETAPTSSPATDHHQPETAQYHPDSDNHATSSSLQPSPSGLQLRRGEAEPLDADYDFFPVSALHPATPDGTALREQFLGRRWATVLRDGLAWLEKNKVNEETAGVLYMIAEAKWQLSRRKDNEPLADVINMFQQASRVDARGDLGAFSAYRQAQAAMIGGDYDTALDCAARAAASGQAAIRQRAALMRIESLERLRRHEEALRVIAAAAGQTSDSAVLVGLHVKEGNLRTAKEDYAGAWAAYEKATALDAEWISLEREGGRGLARAALETGHLAEARTAWEYVNANFSFASEERLSLLLLYARILMAQGDLKAAEDSYYKMLKELPATPGGTDVMQRLFALHPDELLEGQGRYCLLLVQQGKVRQAMADLDEAYAGGLRSGVPVKQLESVLRVVLPLFMETAVAQNTPHEAVEVWKRYSHVAKEASVRQRCLAPLAAALEQLGACDEALRLMRELREAGAAAPVDPLELAVREARLNLKTGNPDRAAAQLQEVLAADVDPERQAELLDLLAEASLKAGAPLEAAQVLQVLAETPGCPMPRRETALQQAGEIFMQAQMPLQTIELGLKGLVLEKEQLEKAAGTVADPASGNAFRMMLARAYAAAGDLARQRIVLEDLLARPELSPELKTQVQIMLSQNQRVTGNLGGAEELYQKVAEDAAADPEWKRSAQQMQKILDWNRRHPEHAIDVITPGAAATKAGAVLTTGTMGMTGTESTTGTTGLREGK